MKDRRRIAVLIGNITFSPYQHVLLDGIISQAFALNYDTAVFAPFMNHEFDSPHQRGENRIYDLIDFEQFDAVIFAPCSFYADSARKLVEEVLDTRCHVPVIALESNDPRYHGILIDDAAAFASVVDHLIEIHHVSKICCLTGFQGNLQAEERLRGFRESMARHGLPVREDWVIYGDFWKEKATAVAEDIAAGRLERPEAVVSACDTSAITLANRLIELGLRVPEDIRIVSYDAGKEASNNVPSITTYARPIKDLGMRGVLTLHKLLTGEDAAPVCEDTGHLITAESCGCRSDFKHSFEVHQREILSMEERRLLFENTPMAEMLNASVTLNELLYHITECLYLIDHVREWYLCLCDGWDDLAKNSNDPSGYNRYTPMMHLRIVYNQEGTHLIDKPFPVSDLLPPLHEDRGKPRAYYITAMRRWLMIRSIMHGRAMSTMHWNSCASGIISTA